MFEENGNVPVFTLTPALLPRLFSPHFATPSLRHHLFDIR